MRLTVLTCISVLLLSADVGPSLADSNATAWNPRPRVIAPKPAATVLRASDSREALILKFTEGTRVRLRGRSFSAVRSDLTAVHSTLSRAGVDMSQVGRLFTLPESSLDEMRERGLARSTRSLADLNLYYRIIDLGNVDLEALCDQLNALDIVESAVPEPVPVELPVDIPPVTPFLVSFQHYRDSPPEGIGASDVSRVAGADGSGTAIADIEYAWTFDHEDLELPPSTYIDTETANDPYPGSSEEHGNAVLGELVAKDNAYGVTGIVPGATAMVVPAKTVESGYNVGRAVTVAASVLGPGDVILIEQQACVCNLAAPCFGPVEYMQSVFDAIEAAVALGIVVVEAGGNGGVDLNQVKCAGVFDRNVRDSGAIIVGAGDSASRARLSFSSYGDRVDLQGWGELVTTLGYGYAFSPGDIRQRYTGYFAGTSSASPIVAGAAAAVQGSLIARGEPPLSPEALRLLLIDTGSPQPLEAESIGPLPDLVAAIGTLDPPVCGDAIHQAGEACDDGNFIDGDCCSSTCTAEVGLACDDGLFCTTASACNSTGDCSAAAYVVCPDADANPCTVDTCDELTMGCVVDDQPAQGCLMAEKNVMQLKDASGNYSDRVKWKWSKGEFVDYAHLGSPTNSTSYRLCIYDETAGAPIAFLGRDIPAGASGWTEHGVKKGIEYKDKLATHDGFLKVRVRPGAAGKSRAQVLLAKSTSLLLPGPSSAQQYFEQDSRVIVQLVNSAGSCWTSEYEAADTRKNNGGEFKAAVR